MPKPINPFGPRVLIDSENHWETAMGAWFPGERVVFRGKDLFADLGHMSWMELLLFGITGRYFSKKQIQLFESIWVISVSFPEPRLWNNRIAALAGTTRATGNLGVSAGIAVSEARVFGQYPFVQCIDFLKRARKAVNSGVALQVFVESELGASRKIYGFGRPIIKKDERIAALLKIVRELGFDDGEYLKLAFATEELLLERSDMLQMNVAALMAALAADNGLSNREFYQYAILCFSIGIVASYADVVEQDEGCFFPIPCASIRCSGCARRQW